MGFSVGGLMGSNSSAKKAAAIQQIYNERTLKNQHQWEMQDLEKANLNPALTLGDTSGSSASAGMPNMGGQNDSMFGLINSAISAYTAKKEAETGETQGALNMAKTANLIEENPYIAPKAKADISNTLAGATNQYAQAGLAHANQELSKEQKNLIKEQKDKTYEEMIGQKQENVLRKHTVEWNERHPKQRQIREYYNNYRPMIQDLGMGLGAISTIKNLKKMSSAKKIRRK